MVDGAILIRITRARLWVMSKKTKQRDTVWVGPELANGHRPFVRQTSTGKSERGCFVPKDEAERAVELKHLGGHCFEVTRETRLTAGGPSQVANPAYRDGWSRIFGGKQAVGQA
jgi:hypothetical protein